MKKATFILFVVLVCMIGFSLFYTFAIKGQFRSDIFWPMVIFSGTLCLWIWNGSYKKHCRTIERDVFVFGHNYPDSLSSINGIGKTMLGDFIFSNGMMVSYCVYIIFGIPVRIYGCYLCTKKGTSYSFFGEIEEKWEEKLYVFTLVPCVIVCVISGMIVLANFFK